MASDDIEARLWQSADESRMIHGDEITGDLLSSAAEEIAGLRVEVGRLDAEVWRLKVEVANLKAENDHLWSEIERFQGMLSDEQVRGELDRRGIDVGPAMDRVRDALRKAKAEGRVP